MSKTLDVLKEIYKTNRPSQASQTSSGATEVGGQKPTAQAGQADYIPLLGLGVGIALLAFAFLRPGARLGSAAVAPLPVEDDPSETGWQEPDQDW